MWTTERYRKSFPRQGFRDPLDKLSPELLESLIADWPTSGRPLLPETEAAIRDSFARRLRPHRWHARQVRRPRLPVGWREAA
jgi:hypothetical protein